MPTAGNNSHLLPAISKHNVNGWAKDTAPPLQMVGIAVPPAMRAVNIYGQSLAKTVPADYMTVL